MDAQNTSRLESIISERAGLKLRPTQRDALTKIVATRLLALKLRDTGSYCQFLEERTPLSELEWQRLISQLTNKESYFFRDKGQMALLREHILPEIIERNKSTRSLRIWSAGCATGEEAFSLAMLVEELLPHRGRSSGPEWKVSILGTDIDERALEFARRGMYGAWSFRTSEPAIRNLLFTPQDGGWLIPASSKSVVSFQTCNLVSDNFPSPTKGIEEMDLILCRNVFIYFHRKAVSRVIEKFSRTLRPGGYLMTGHVETRGLPVEPLVIRKYPDSEIFQRPLLDAVEVIKSVVSPTIDFVSSRRPTQPSKETQCVGAVVPGGTESSDREWLLLRCARELADKGHYVESIECCRMISEEFPFSAEAYSLRASIAQDQGCNEEAKLLLKKALYLSPDSPHLHMELGALYSSEGDATRSEIMNVAALRLLEQLSPSSPVGYSGGPNAGECITHLAKIAAAGA